MPRGRPKGSKNKITTIINSDSIPQEEDLGVKIKTYKTSTFCELCGKEILCSPIKINLNILTGKAIWHRTSKKDRFNICNTCATELNTLIDNFIINKNKNLIKFS